MRPRQVVLLTPLESVHPHPLPSHKHLAILTPLDATLMHSPVSVANKRLTAALSPLAATLTKNREVGAPPFDVSTFGPSNVQTIPNSLSPVLHPTDHRQLTRPDPVGATDHSSLSPAFACPPWRATHTKTTGVYPNNSYSETLPTLRPSDFPTFGPFRRLDESPTSGSLFTNNCKLTTVDCFFPRPVDIQPVAGHNFPSAPSPRMAPITEEGE
jgi:hypothetical protein